MTNFSTIGIPSLEPGQLLHGTTFEASCLIEKSALVPMRGAFIDEMYGTSEDNAAGEPGIFFSNPFDEDGIWGAANAMKDAVARLLGKKWNDITLDEIAVHGAMVVVKPGQHDAFKLNEEGRGISLAGNSSDVEPPCGAEESDYYTFENQYPIRIIVGADLVELVRHVRRYGDEGDYMFLEDRPLSQRCTA